MCAVSLNSFCEELGGGKSPAFDCPETEEGYEEKLSCAGTYRIFTFAFYPKYDFIVQIVLKGTENEWAVISKMVPGDPSQEGKKWRIAS